MSFYTIQEFNILIFTFLNIVHKVVTAILHITISSMKVHVQEFQHLGKKNQQSDFFRLCFSNSFFSIKKTSRQKKKKEEDETQMIKGNTAGEEITYLTRNISGPSAEEEVHTKALVKRVCG